VEIGISRSSARERPARGGSQLWRSGSPDLVRERETGSGWGGGGVCEERPARGGWAGVGQRAESRGREREKRKRAEQMPHACFGRKMVYGKFFRKPFS
jgi:hypothetical protein